MRLSLIEWLLGAAAAVLLVVVVVQTLRIGNLEDKNATLAADVAIYQGAQVTNLDTIDVLQAANAGWAEKCRSDPAATKAALKAITAERDRLTSDLAEARQNREVIYVRDPVARDWRNSPVPVALANQLYK